MSNCNLSLKFASADPKQSSHLSGYTLGTCVHEIDVCNLMLFIRSCSSNEESKVMSRNNKQDGGLRLLMAVFVMAILLMAILFMAILLTVLCV